MNFGGQGFQGVAFFIGIFLVISGPAQIRQFATDSDVQPVFSSIVVDQSNNEVSGNLLSAFCLFKCNSLTFNLKCAYWCKIVRLHSLHTYRIVL